jgi:hypothetical protein
MHGDFVLTPTLTLNEHIITTKTNDIDASTLLDRWRIAWYYEPAVALFSYSIRYVVGV